MSVTLENRLIIIKWLNRTMRLSKKERQRDSKAQKEERNIKIYAININRVWNAKLKTTQFINGIGRKRQNNNSNNSSNNDYNIICTGLSQFSAELICKII